MSVLILNFPKIAIDAPPLAPALLCEICEQNSVDYNFVDCNLDFFQQLNKELNTEILGMYAERLITDLTPSANTWLDAYFSALATKCKEYDLVAISVFSVHSVAIVYKFLAEHRNKFNSKIVVGGAGISSLFPAEEKFYQYLNKQKLIDFWVLGEGEIGFKDILLNQLPSQSVNTLDFNSLDTFDDVPIPNFTKFNLENYIQADGKKIISVEGSRGCVKKCTFCNIGSTWGTYKYKDGEKLANEILSLKLKYNPDHFWFNDSLINGSLKAFRGFIKHLSAYQTNRFTWSSQAIIREHSPRDEEDFKLLKASGCTTLAVGVESFSERVRFHMGKKFTNDDLDHFLNLAQKYNISIYLLMIIGYPTETQEDFDFGLTQLEKYQHLADDGTISGIRIGGTMNIHQDIPIFKMKEKIGLKFVDNDPRKHVSWYVGDNTLQQRVKWRIEFEDHARSLGYNCADNEMSIEETLLNFLKNK
jgi:anaerobic magnesium-protoporphyrin IX monomethyl ester cyclase